MTRPVCALILAVLAICVPASAAGAQVSGPAFDLPGEGYDPQVLVAPDGTGHVTYTADPSVGPHTLHYCQLKPGQTRCLNGTDLPIPQFQGLEISGQSFALLDGATVRLAMPRYNADDVLLWTSTAGGAPGSFTGPVTISTTHRGTDSDRLFAVGGRLLIASWNPGMYFQSVALDGSAVEEPSAELPSPLAGFVYDTDVALHGAEQTPIVTAWDLAGLNEGRNQIAFWRPNGASFNDSAAWAGPNVITEGDNSTTSAGGRGTFLFYTSYRPGQSFTDRLALRRFDGTAFGAPVRVGDEVGNFPEVFQDSAADGRVWTAWRLNASPYQVRLAVSADGGRTFSAPWTLVTDERLVTNLRGAALPNGTGWLVWEHNGRSTITASPLVPSQTIKPSQVIRLPKTCRSRRNFQIRLRIPRGVGVEAVQVQLNGRNIRTVRGERITARIDLRGLPRQRVRVRISVTLAGGKLLRGTRTYRTCSSRRLPPGRIPVQ